MQKPDRPRKQILFIYFNLTLLAIIGLEVFLVALSQHLPTGLPQEKPLLSESFDGKLGSALDSGKAWEDQSFKFNLKLRSKWYFAVNHAYHEPYIPFEYSDDPSTYLESIVTAGDSSWSDYAFRLTVEPLDNYGFGIVFRYQDINNYFRVMVVRDPKAGGPYVSLEKRVNGKLSTISIVKKGSGFYGNYNPGQWYRLKVTANKENLEVFVDGNSIIKAPDKTFTKGKIGLLAWEHSSAFFDDVLVLKIN